MVHLWRLQESAPCSCSVAVITSDSESDNPGSSPGRSVPFSFRLLDRRNMSVRNLEVFPFRSKQFFLFPQNRRSFRKNSHRKDRVVREKQRATTFVKNKAQFVEIKTRQRVRENQKNVRTAGIEPATLGFGIQCSTTELSPHGVCFLRFSITEFVMYNCDTLGAVVQSSLAQSAAR